MNGASMLVVPSSFVGGYERVRSYVSPPSWFSHRKGHSEYSNGGYSLTNVATREERRRPRTSLDTPITIVLRFYATRHKWEERSVSRRFGIIVERSA